MATQKAIDNMTTAIGVILHCMSSFKETPEALETIENVVSHKSLLTSWMDNLNESIVKSDMAQPGKYDAPIEKGSEKEKSNDTTKAKAKEEEKLVKAKAKEEEKLAKAKAKEDEKLAKAKAKEDEKLAKAKAKEDEKLAKAKTASQKPRGRPKKNVLNIDENTKRIEKLILKHPDDIEEEDDEEEDIIVNYDDFVEITAEDENYFVYNSKSNQHFKYGDVFTHDFERNGCDKCGEYNFDTQNIVFC